MDMKAIDRKTWPRYREFLVGSSLLCLYGTALLCSDPEWAIWAGAMSVGALPLEAPPALSFSSNELISGSGSMALLGLGIVASFLLGRRKRAQGASTPGVKPFTAWSALWR